MSNTKSHEHENAAGNVIPIPESIQEWSGKNGKDLLDALQWAAKLEVPPQSFTTEEANKFYEGKFAYERAAWEYLDFLNKAFWVVWDDFRKESYKPNQDKLSEYYKYLSAKKKDDIMSPDAAWKDAIVYRIVKRKEKKYVLAFYYDPTKKLKPLGIGCRSAVDGENDDKNDDKIESLSTRCGWEFDDDKWYWYYDGKGRTDEKVLDLSQLRNEACEILHVL